MSSRKRRSGQGESSTMGSHGSSRPTVHGQNPTFRVDQRCTAARLINDNPELEFLRVRFSVITILEALGWTGLFYFMKPTYTGCVEEFLRTLEPLDGQDGFSFRSGGQRYEIPLYSLSRIFDWETEDVIRSVSLDQLLAIWPAAYVHQGRHHGPGGTDRHAWYIMSDAIYYVMRVLGSSVFGRDNSEYFTWLEDMLLYACYSRTRIDWGYLVTQQFLEASRGTGAIYFGPLVTEIYERLSLPLTGRRIDSEIVDLEFLVNAGAVWCDRERYEWFPQRDEDPSVRNALEEASRVGYPLYRRTPVPRPPTVTRRTIASLGSQQDRLEDRLSQLSLRVDRTERRQRRMADNLTGYFNQIDYQSAWGYYQTDEDEDDL